MTKRERERFGRAVARLSNRVGKKRDELREVVEIMEALIDSVRDADEDTEAALHHLEEAAVALDRGTVEKLSQYV